ncbi:MAG: hypothetical protein ABS36_08635 [Acidobacteria bacterium SCN 69-37]|nr:MAG: hypothetical protein ABS36_08635 [Acidobacteria bacterium SCN 69-37]
MNDTRRPRRGGFDPRRALSPETTTRVSTLVLVAAGVAIGAVGMMLIEGKITVSLSHPQNEAPRVTPTSLPPAPAPAAATPPAPAPAIGETPGAPQTAAPDSAIADASAVPPAPEPYGETREAKLIFGPSPSYPPLARQARIAGVVSVDLVVDEEGRVVDAKANRSANPILGAAAVAAVSEWRYLPALRHGQPVPVRLTTTIAFKLDGR